jgi:hypothetical protein
MAKRQPVQSPARMALSEVSETLCLWSPSHCKTVGFAKRARCVPVSTVGEGQPQPLTEDRLYRRRSRRPQVRNDQRQRLPKLTAKATGSRATHGPHARGTHGQPTALTASRQTSTRTSVPAGHASSRDTDLPSWCCQRWGVSVTLMELQEVILRRRMVRRFADEPVSPQSLLTVVDEGLGALYFGIVPEGLLTMEHARSLIAPWSLSRAT